MLQAERRERQRVQIRRCDPTELCKLGLHCDGVGADSEGESVSDDTVTRLVRGGRDESTEGAQLCFVDLEPQFFIEFARQSLRGILSGLWLATRLHELGRAVLSHHKHTAVLVVDDCGAHVDVRHARIPFRG